ncbi:hypothetical protein BH23THE1_BH23THE1_32200 [soil metagenome]
MSTPTEPIRYESYTRPREDIYTSSSITRRRPNSRTFSLRTDERSRSPYSPPPSRSPPSLSLSPESVDPVQNLPMQLAEESNEDRMQRQLNNLEYQLQLSERNYSQVLQQNNNIQQILGIVVKTIIVSSLPVNIGGVVQYIRLISQDDLEGMRDQIASLLQLGDEYKNLLAVQNQVGFTFVSEINRQPLHTFKPQYNVFLLTTHNGTHYVIYAQLTGTELFFN